MVSAAVGTLGHYLGRIFFTVAATLLIYCGVNAIRRLFKAYQEVLLMWTAVFGGRWMPKEKSLRIQPYLCRTAELDDVSVQECFQFHYQAFQPTDENITREQVYALYRRVLLSYSHILLCREKLDGSLRGIVLLGLEYKKTHTLVKVGLLLTQKHYRGGPWMKVVVACLLMKELVLHPFVPVYVIGKLSTYKPYLIATMMPDTHPRYDKEPPEEYKKIAEEFVRSVQSPGDEYDRDTFVLRRRTATVHEQLAAISERDLQNPHIRFFNEHNPGWKEGDQLVALVRMTLKGLLLHLVKVTIRQFKPSSSSNIPRGNVARGNVNRKKAAQLRAQLSRGISYQDMEAGLHSLRFHARERNKDEGNGDGNMNSFPSFIQRLYNHSDDEDFNINF